MTKRVVNIFGVGAGLLLLSPVVLVMALLIRRQMGRPVFFRQTHTGLHGRLFEMINFRTMRNAADEWRCAVTHLERFLRV